VWSGAAWAFAAPVPFRNNGPQTGGIQRCLAVCLPCTRPPEAGYSG
jgi:hypothetical protein